jgi:NTP pyrophosphatase (non-canonical NTP hydrolase)
MTTSSDSVPPSQFEALLRELRGFVEEREWGKFHDPKNLSMAVASEAGELLALFRWVRGEESDAFASNPENRERIKAEIADVTISLLLLSDRIGIDLQQAILDKLEINRANYPVESSRGRADRPKKTR